MCDILSVCILQLLRAAIEEVTNMNQGIEVEKIECVKQIKEVNGK